MLGLLRGRGWRLHYGIQAHLARRGVLHWQGSRLLKRRGIGGRCTILGAEDEGCVHLDMHIISLRWRQRLGLASIP